MILIDGKKIANEIKDELARDIADYIDHEDRVPHLAAVLVGNDPASQTYVKSKEKACQRVGMTSSIYKYPETITEKELLEVVDFINNDDDIDGLIVQLPLPDHIASKKFIQQINR